MLFRSQIKKLFLTPEDATPTKDALEAVRQADIVILGPGSLYTSIIPNLIINGMAQTLSQSAAYKIYVCNVMTQPGETDGYSASEHVKAIVDHTMPGVVNAVIVNNADVPVQALGKYEEQGQFPVKLDLEKIKEMELRLIATDLLSVNDYVRHDSEKLTAALIRLIESQRVIKR